MEPIRLSRWPTFQIGQAPSGFIEVYVIDTDNISDELSHLKLTRQYDDLRIENGNSIYIILSSKTLNSSAGQRKILKRLFDKLKSQQFKSFTGCNFHVKTLKFNIENIREFIFNLYEFSCFKAEDRRVKDIYIDGISEEESIKINSISSLLPWICFTKDLVNYPPNLKPPERLAAIVREMLIKNDNVNTEIFMGEYLEHHFNAVAEVGKGSKDKPILLRIEYKPTNSKNPKPIVLIGKGVTYDVGGYNIKTDEDDLRVMKLDMAGAAAAAGICGYFSSNKWPIHIIIYLPLVENMIGPLSLKPGDIVKIPITPNSKDIKSEHTYIEVSDTDAEGRLLLSNVTAFSSLNDNPELIITIATLCGATEFCLGYKIAAAISKTKLLLDTIESAGRQTGEQYATIRPSQSVLDEYLDDYKSYVGQFTNYESKVGDTMHAFALIQYFANKVPFLHLDICGTAFLLESSKKNNPGATGWGVASVIEFIKRYLKNGEPLEPTR